MLNANFIMMMRPFGCICDIPIEKVFFRLKGIRKTKVQPHTFPDMLGSEKKRFLNQESR